jgi:hypothetical protein
MKVGMAAAYYGMPDKIARKAINYLRADMVEVIANNYRLIILQQ